MGKPSKHGSGDSSDQPPRPRVSADATIALSERQLREMEVAAGVKTAAPPIPARATRPKPAAVPHDASVWAGKIMLADEIAPTAPSKGRRRRWALAGVLAAAAIAAGVYVAHPWWGAQPVVSAGKVVEPAARVAPPPPPPAPTPAPTPVAAAEPATPPPAMTKTTTSTTEQTATTSTSKTVKKTTRKRTASRSTTIKKTTKRHSKRIRKTTRRRRHTTRDN